MNAVISKHISFYNTITLTFIFNCAATDGDKRHFSKELSISVTELFRCTYYVGDFSFCGYVSKPMEDKHTANQ